MLEIPECKNLVKQIKSTLINKKIIEVIVANNPHKFAFFYDDITTYKKQLLNKCITDCRCFGGQLEILIEDKSLLLSEGINLRYQTKEKALPKKHQLFIGFDDESCVFLTISMYGFIGVFDTGTYDNQYYTIACSKPDIESDTFDEAYFLDLLATQDEKTSIKAALATKQSIPGLGNGILQDILFNAKINPKTRLDKIDLAKRKELFKALKETVNEMIQKGGRDIESDLFGVSGFYQTKMSSKTLTVPCSLCYNTIIKEAYLGGNVYYCPVCQPKI